MCALTLVTDAQKPTVETLVQQITESIERIRPFGVDNTSQTDPNTDTGSAESQEKCKTKLVSPLHASNYRCRFPGNR
jgi:hypothetical protein